MIFLIFLLLFLLFLINLFNLSICIKKKNYAGFVFISLLFVYLIYVHFVPEIFQVLTDFRRLEKYEISLANYYKTIYLDLFFVLQVSILSSIFFFKKIKHYPEQAYTSKFDLYFLNSCFFIIILSTYIYMESIFFTGPSRYGINIKYDSINNPYQSFSFINQLIERLNVIIPLSKFSLIIFLLEFKKIKLLYSKIFVFFSYVISIFLLFLIILNGINSGVRMEIFNLFLIYFVIKTIKENKISKNLLMLSVLCFSFFLIIASIMGSDFREKITENENFSVYEKIQILIDEGVDTINENRIFNEIGYLIEMRFTDIETSSSLIVLKDSHKGANFMPTLNSTLSFIPRILWKDKPAPSSVDGTHNGLAGFLVWNTITGNNFTNWGGYTASSHHYWEGGYLYIFIWGLVYSYLLSTIILRSNNNNNRFQNFYLFLLIVVFNVYKFDSFLIPTLADLLSRFFRYLVIFYIIYFFMKLYSKIFQNKKLKKLG